MPIITLSTDFGVMDEYVGVMKGVILNIYPSVTVIDVTHDLPAHDVRWAAYALDAYYRFFPRDTVHLMVVDPGVGTDRRILAAEVEGHTFVVPDNGVLTQVIARAGAERITSVENAAYYLSTISRTFHGRDIFAPVAAYISKGVNLERMGPTLPPESIHRLPLPRPEVRKTAGGRTLTGTVILADRFGNLTTNIDAGTLADFMADDRSEDLTADIKGNRIRGLSPSYASAAPGEPLIIVGSRDYLEIAVNKGSAKDDFGIDGDETVTLEISERSIS